MHEVEYTLMLTGSQLFDLNVLAAAKKLCADYPGLAYEQGDATIRVYGQLDDAAYEKYQQEMFGA